MGFSPQVVDFDADGRNDIISGSYMPGELFLFRGTDDGGFAARQTITGASGENLLAGSVPPAEPKNLPVPFDTAPRPGSRYNPESLASVPFATDWDGDGDLDLLVGNIVGQVILIRNDGSASQPSFSSDRVKLQAAGADISVPHGDAGPVVADWDGDGLPDLIVGAGDGSVLLYRNTGTREKPSLAATEALVASALPSEGGWMTPAPPSSEPFRSGMRAKVCATDYDGDGRLDLLVGDLSMTARQDPSLTDAQRSRRDTLRKEQADLGKQMQELHEQIVSERGGQESLDDPSLMSDPRVAALQEKMMRIWEELSPMEPGFDNHGWVWLYLRR